MSENKGRPPKSNILTYIFAVLFGIGIGGLILLLNKTPTPEMIKILPTATESPLVAHIVGEVKTPGIYELEKGARVSDLVEIAGGFTASADQGAVNLAGRVWDGQQINIPAMPIQGSTNGNEIHAVTETDNEVVFSYPININYCSKEELMSLPGIGEAKADAIILYREQQNSFEVIEDIMKVNGIGEAIFESIKNLITVK